MKTMKAAVLHAPGDLRVEQVPVPEPGLGAALVRVAACGVCGSDVPRVRTTGTYHFPTVPGHEMSGVVEALGSDGPVPGTPVSVVPLIPCRRCRYCEIGQFAQCTSYDFLGSRSNGGFAEFLVAPVQNLVPLPRGVDIEEGALLEPITVALHAARNLGVSWGESVAVFGLGAIGNFVAQWARALGASHVFGIDVAEEKVRIAREVGLGESFRSAGLDVPGLLRERTAGAGVDVAFDASGAPAAINQAIAALRSFGRLGLLGRPTSGVSIQADAFERILRGQLTLRGTWSFELAAFPRHPWDEAAQALAQGVIQAGLLITHRVPIEKVGEAIEMMAAGREPFHKVMMVNPGRTP